MPHQLRLVRIGDDPASWRRAGFVVNDDVASIGGVHLRFAGESNGRGIQGWNLESITESIDGLEVAALGGVGIDPAPSAHPNGVTGVDHLVIRTDNVDRTAAALAAHGIEERRTRIIGGPDGPTRQSFFWIGDVILELVGPDEAAPQTAGPASFWGIALTSDDLGATARFLGELASSPTDAVQPGRQISTLRTRDLGISVPVAIMSPHAG